MRPSLSSRRWLLLFALATCWGCHAGDDPIRVSALEVERAQARFRVELALGYLPGSLVVHFDGERVPITRLGLHGPFDTEPLSVVPTRSTGALMLEARFLDAARGGVVTRRRSFNFRVPADTASLAASWPEHGTRGLPRSEWIQLMFASTPSAETMASFVLTCRGRDVPFDSHRIDAGFVLLNPLGELPSASQCLLSWAGRFGEERLFFSTASAGESVEVVYSRERPNVAAPFPDDFWTREAPYSSTRRRIEMPQTPGDSGLDRLSRALTRELDGLDGFSPAGPIVIEVAGHIDPASLPAGTVESLHPASSIALLDLDPQSPDFARRVSFETEVRTTRSSQNDSDHATLLVHPSLPLRPGGRYGLIVTRAVRANASQPAAPSAFLAAALAPPAVSESKAISRLRELLAPLLWVSEELSFPPIPRDDIALALCFSVGTLRDMPRDLHDLRHQVFREPLPRYEIEQVVGDESGGPLAAVVHGIWHAPRFRKRTVFVANPRGVAEWSGTDPIPFTLALPRLASGRRAPIVIYQHGNPGNAKREVPEQARRSLAAAGFGVIGFTDVFNRELTPNLEGDPAILRQLIGVAEFLLREQRMPEYWLQTHGEQIAFLRLIEALADLDVLPLEAPDGEPDLDLDAPLAYLGVSEGANHGLAFLVFAPEVRAAALVAGGAPITRVLAHQLSGTQLESLAAERMGGRLTDLLVGLALYQTAVDRQDPFNFARLLYRSPVTIDGTTRKASILLIAGVDDARVPNAGTDALAWLLGPLPLLEPAPRDVPFLERSPGPIQANIDAETSAAYYQVAPVGIPGVEATPGCRESELPDFLGRDGHYCAQLAAESLHERRVFFETMLRERAPVIARPLGHALERTRKDGAPSD